MTVVIEHGEESYCVTHSGLISVSIADKSTGMHHRIDIATIGEQKPIDEIEMGDYIISLKYLDTDLVEKFTENYAGDLLCEITVEDIHITALK